MNKSPVIAHIKTRSKVLITSGTLKFDMWACLVVCVQCMHVLINWCWLWYPKLAVFCSWTLLCGGGCAPLGWPLTFPTPLHWPGRDLPVQFSQLMRCRTQVEWRVQSGWRRGCKRLLNVWVCGGGFAPPTQEVDCVVVVRMWWNVIDIIVCLLVLSCIIGIVCGLTVGFWWSIKIFWRMVILEEQNGAVVGVLWPFPSIQAYWVH